MVGHKKSQELSNISESTSRVYAYSTNSAMKAIGQVTKTTTISRGGRSFLAGIADKMHARKNRHNRRFLAIIELA